MSPRTLISSFRKSASIGADNIIHCRFSYDRPSAQISVGDRCFIGKSHIVVAQSVSIGNDVVISWGVTIVDHNSHSIDWEGRADDVRQWHLGKKDWTNIVIKPVTICDRVWIGFNASILKGVTLGEGCVVAACSVVTKDVLPFTIVAGNPAKVVKTLRNPKG